MNYTQGEIFLGDLVRAFAQIGVGDQEKVRIVARLLGFDLEAALTETRVELTPTAPPDLKPSGRQKFETAQVETASDIPSQSESPRHSGYGAISERVSESDLPVIITSVSRFDLERHPTTAPPKPKAAADWPEWGRSSSAKFPLQSLLLSEWTRGILSELVPTCREVGKLDLRRAIETLARGKSPDRLPLASVRTLARGCQVLLDVSDGMAPFARDSRDLIQSLQRIVGQERIEVLHFDNSPLQGVETGPDLDFVPYKPPPYGTPVLLISDLGIANPPFSLRRVMTRDWLELIRWLDEVGCPIVAIVPYPPSRWPNALSQALPIIQWDHRTSASDVRRARQRR